MNFYYDKIKELLKNYEILRTNIFNIQNFKGNDNDAESFLFHNNETFCFKT